MRIGGMKQKEIADATAAAWKTARDVLTTTPAENLRAIGELRTVFGDTGEAIAVLPQIQKLQSVLTSLTGTAQEGLAYTTMRAVEMLGGTINPHTGQIDPTRSQEMIDLMTKASIATHGKVDPRQWLNFAQTAGGVVKNMDPSALIMGMAPIIQEMGGFRAGTALTALNQQIVGGVMPQRVVADWVKYGLVDESKISATRMGVRVAPGGVVGEEVWKRNPLQWIEDTFIPALKKKGVSQEGISDEIIRLFGRQTSQREASLMATQLVRIHKDIQMAEQAMASAPAYEELVKNDPMLAAVAAQKQWAAFEQVIGIELLPVLIPLIHQFAEGLSWLTGILREYPGLARALAWGFTGLAGALAFSGVVLVLVAAFKALRIALTLGGLIPAIMRGVLALFGVGGALTTIAGGAGAVSVLLGVAGAIGLIAAAKKAGDAGQSWFNKLFGAPPPLNEWVNDPNSPIGISPPADWLAAHPEYQRVGGAPPSSDSAQGDSSTFEAFMKVFKKLFGISDAEAAEIAAAVNGGPSRGFASKLPYRIPTRHEAMKAAGLHHRQAPSGSGLSRALDDVLANEPIGRSAPVPFTPVSPVMGWGRGDGHSVDEKTLGDRIGAYVKAALAGIHIELNGTIIGKLLFAPDSPPTDTGSSFDGHLSPAYPTGAW
jgi:hypothetical protein